MSLIHVFPPEVLGEIFKCTMSRPSSPLAVTHVSRRWREVALTNSDLWRRVEVSPKDIRHPDLLYERLKRSKGRTICLALDFDAFHAPFDRDALQTVMWIVRRHLGRCYELSVTTPWEAWMDIVVVLLTEVAYKNLIALDLRLLEPAKGSSYFREPYPFYLPDEHKLQRVSLDGMMVKCRSLKYLTEIRMMNEGAPRLGFWLTHLTEKLSLEDFLVPETFPSVPGGPIDPVFSPITHLVLNRLRATPLTGFANGERSCVPFFTGLQTPYLLTLEILDWDVRGRAWSDFLASLPAAQDKYLHVTRLRLREMHFYGLGYHQVALFLGSFPVLATLQIEECFPGTWEIAMDVLEVDGKLCPAVTEIRLHNALVLYRDDPLPFRNATMLGSSGWAA
ncbi:hypothetical protein DFH07DRAFT_577338 [Mycena maculata]|uniref:F-box domain-containing protein n=1 Tax=Mycena maculata TaxID=230809 RepID=A0AAD7IPI6_9AGAR|nr:hypothetical protein DFH07DRAFT_577338 [Mycena maculata]